jgi:hypothetical protein
VVFGRRWCCEGRLPCCDSLAKPSNRHHPGHNHHSASHIGRPQPAPHVVSTKMSRPASFDAYTTTSYHSPLHSCTKQDCGWVLMHSAVPNMQGTGVAQVAHPLPSQASAPACHHAAFADPCRGQLTAGPSSACCCMGRRRVTHPSYTLGSAKPHCKRWSMGVAAVTQQSGGSSRSSRSRQPCSHQQQELHQPCLLH